MKVGDLVWKKWSKLKGVGIVIGWCADPDHVKVFWATQKVQTQTHHKSGLEPLK